MSKKHKEESLDHYPFQLVLEQQDVQDMVASYMAAKGYLITSVELEVCDEGMVFARCYGRIFRNELPEKVRELMRED